LLGYFVWKITILRQKLLFFQILGGGGDKSRVLWKLIRHWLFTSDVVVEARGSSDLSFIGMWNITFKTMWPLHRQSYCNISMKNASNKFNYIKYWCDLNIVIGIECILLKFHWGMHALIELHFQHEALHWKCTSVNACIPQWNFKRMHSILKKQLHQEHRWYESSYSEINLQQNI
jgi:hypothetical protein